MKLPRRQFLHLAAGAAALPAVARTARAQAYPTRPVRVVVTYAAGGPNDIIARLMGQWLTEHLGQPFVVENRPGAAGNIGTEAVVRAPADGYTILLASTNNAINAALYDKLNFNFIRDIAPVAAISRSMFVMVVHPSIPAKTVPEFIAYSKANPGKINMASSGIGSTSHVFGELFRMMTGVDTAHVPYRGMAPAMTANRRTGASLLRPHARIDRVHQIRQAARAGGDDRDTLGSVAGRACHRRICFGLRGERLVGHWLAQKYSHRSHQQAQQRNQRRPRRSKVNGTACRAWRYGACTLARSVRDADCRHNRKVGQGGKIRGHETGVTEATGIRPYIGARQDVLRAIRGRSCKRER
jgi:hypothetical protein